MFCFYFYFRRLTWLIGKHMPWASSFKVIFTERNQEENIPKCEHEWFTWELNFLTSLLESVPNNTKNNTTTWREIPTNHIFSKTNILNSKIRVRQKVKEASHNNVVGKWEVWRAPKCSRGQKALWHIYSPQMRTSIQEEGTVEKAGMR